VTETIHYDKRISLQEVCEYPGDKSNTVMGCIDQRSMLISKVGKIWRFKTINIDEWIKKGGTSVELEGIK
jgi:hypothetical protein